jgi:hypothetical protein
VSLGRVSGADAGGDGSTRHRLPFRLTPRATGRVLGNSAQNTRAWADEGHVCTDLYQRDERPGRADDHANNRNLADTMFRDAEGTAMTSSRAFYVTLSERG